MTYNFCLKIIEDSASGKFDTVDNLSLEVQNNSGVFSHADFEYEQVVNSGQSNALFEISKFANTLNGISTYEIMNKGCSTTATDMFIDASNIIASLDGGKLKA